MEKYSTGWQEDIRRVNSRKVEGDAAREKYRWPVERNRHLERVVWRPDIHTYRYVKRTGWWYINGTCVNVQGAKREKWWQVEKYRVQRKKRRRQKGKYRVTTNEEILYMISRGNPIFICSMRQYTLLYNTVWNEGKHVQYTFIRKTGLSCLAGKKWPGPQVTWTTIHC